MSMGVGQGERKGQDREEEGARRMEEEEKTDEEENRLVKEGCCYANTLLKIILCLETSELPMDGNDSNNHNSHCRWRSNAMNDNSRRMIRMIVAFTKLRKRR